jgi:single-strand DNA-binding protein
MNVVTLIGNLATEIELKDVAPDKKVASFLLAVDRQGKDAGADFIHVATWNRQAEVCDEYLSKGSRVAVDGRLRSRSWEDAEGKRRSAVEVVANSIQFLDTRRREESPFERYSSQTSACLFQVETLTKSAPASLPGLSTASRKLATFLSGATSLSSISVARFPINVTTFTLPP